MALTPEAKVKKEVVKILNAHDAYYFFPATGGFGRSGVPDIIVCFKGHFIGIECKAKNNTPTALQLRELQKIVVAGGFSVVINEDNIFRVKEILDAVV
jgi:Holliday junction resolvase